jgi:ribonuclease HI
MKDSTFLSKFLWAVGASTGLYFFSLFLEKATPVPYGISLSVAIVSMAPITLLMLSCVPASMRPLANKLVGVVYALAGVAVIVAFLSPNLSQAIKERGVVTALHVAMFTGHSGAQAEDNLLSDSNKVTDAVSAAWNVKVKNKREEIQAAAKEHPEKLDQLVREFHDLETQAAIEIAKARDAAKPTIQFIKTGQPPRGITPELLVPNHTYVLSSDTHMEDVRVWIRIDELRAQKPKKVANWEARHPGVKLVGMWQRLEGNRAKALADFKGMKNKKFFVADSPSVIEGPFVLPANMSFDSLGLEADPLVGGD